jgi:predicted O-linked N-acetylglucosamine transferase (SPINDLY family)
VVNLKLQNLSVTALWRDLRLKVTQPLLWQALARQYAQQSLPWQGGYTARQAVRLDASLTAAVQTLGLAGWQNPGAGDAQLGRASLPEAAALAKRFCAVIAAQPGDWLTWLYLARLLDMVQEMDASTDSVDLPTPEHALQQAQALEPIAGESLHWLGVWRLSAGDAKGAVAALSGLLGVRPVRFGSMMVLGEALLAVGNTAAAEKAFARASLSDNPDFLLSLSAKVYAHNYWQEALQVLKKALGLRPASVPLWLALAKIQSDVYALADCAQSLKKVQALEPNNAEAQLLRAGLQGRMGDAKGHLATLEAAYAQAGDPLSRLASSIAMTSLYHDGLSSSEVADLHRRVCAPIEAALVEKTDFALQSAGPRRLRLGLVTGDLHRQHPVNIFILPVLLRLDHSRLEVFVYHTGTMHDEYTRQAKASADHWTEAVSLTDRALHQAIVGDGVDVLVDLGGHTSTHRLGVFAMRAAPVQTTFLGYPHSTGLSRIDWLVGDKVVSPAEHAHLFSEGIAQLPGSVFCWAPVDVYPLPPHRPTGVPVVFGSFNNAMKLSPKTISLWAQVLQAVAGSQLLLKAPSLRDAAVQERFAALFAQHGIAKDRLIFRGPSGLADMMQEYGVVDIGLDPTPYNGGTTTLQALWMGVPVITLLGNNFVGRMGASFMQTLGRTDWVATDEATYVQAAVRLAADIAQVRSGRAQLRAQMAESALCDINTYANHFEALLHTMWDHYCLAGNGGEQTRLISADNSRQRQVTGRGKAEQQVLAVAEKDKKTYCVGVACVRNEADVVEMWARYNLQLIDELHVVDNLSVDSTRWLLQQLQAEGLKLHIHECGDPSYPQGLMLTRVAREVAKRPEVDFVLPLDADELLALPNRAAFHAALATIPPGCAGAMTWRTYLPAPGADSGQPFFRRMTRHRSLENRGHDKLVLRAALCAEHSWSQGSHNAFHDQTGQPVRRVHLPFKLAHFPVRDADQLARKVLVGAQAVLRNPKRGKKESWHWLALAEQLQQADAKGQRLDLERIALAYSLGEEVLPLQKIAEDPVPDFPALMQKYPMPSMSKAEVIELLKDA